MTRHHKINYIEFPAIDLPRTKDFYSAAFGWEFQDWGDTYVSFSSAGIDGGFELDSPDKQPTNDGALVILFSEDLVATESAVRAAGGVITTAPFDFPGGRRFHFKDPNGNHLAVWGEPSGD